MKVLAFAEQRENTFKKSAFETVQAARRAADRLGAECAALVIGSGVHAVAGELAHYGVARILVADDPVFAQHSSTGVSAAIADVMRRENADMLFLPASQMGKDIAPRVAVKLGAGLAADCIALDFVDGGIVATRPAYAGKALIDVRITTPVKIFTLRPNVFTAAPVKGEAVLEKIAVAVDQKEFGCRVQSVTVGAGRPDVTEADIIVSGGRGLKGPEHFHLIEELADVLGAGVGASRAVVDAGWRPHDEQVGQTGKTVSPTLYVACGISGAVQHLAGMSSSKFIVAINKDKDAPIFQIADYGVVGDVFDILPELTVQLKGALGR